MGLTKSVLGNEVRAWGAHWPATRIQPKWNPYWLETWRDEDGSDYNREWGNIVKACKEKPWRNMTCFGHNLHLAITTTIEKQPNVSRAIGVCKKVVAAFNISWKRKKALSEAQLHDNPGIAPPKLASVSINFLGLTLLLFCSVVPLSWNKVVFNSLGINTQNDSTGVEKQKSNSTGA